jgi:prophage antirepressor-like protein
VHKIRISTNGGIQKLKFINEPNLYRVIFRSNKKEALNFQNWVFAEVLPTIRKTGGYSFSKTNRF